uniref:Uncharacterized protein n=1 Tax=Steinernema glaseri TaxID=37863 RepID=A0A1I7YL97_9BILA
MSRQDPGPSRKCSGVQKLSSTLAINNSLLSQSTFSIHFQQELIIPSGPLDTGRSLSSKHAIHKKLTFDGVLGGIEHRLDELLERDVTVRFFTWDPARHGGLLRPECAFAVPLWRLTPQFGRNKFCRIIIINKVAVASREPVGFAADGGVGSAEIRRTTLALSLPGGRSKCFMRKSEGGEDKDRRQNLEF